MMTYEETLQYIHTINWRGSKLGLERVRELLARLGNPQDCLRFVHVAGTNGKGSTSCMLASVLEAAGYKTGLYISPFIERFNERIQINGVPISDEDLCAVVEQVKAEAEAMEHLPTEFEIVCAVAMVYYAQQNCDIVVLEVGLGGRLDATNAVNTTAVAVITALGLDHQVQLGNTLAKIAGEKCGIIKDGIRVVSEQQPAEAMAVVQKVCAEKGCGLRVRQDVRPLAADIRTGQRFVYNENEYTVSLLGEHQTRNAALVIETADALRETGYTISEEAVVQGIAAAKWPARFELLGTDPIVVVDGAHNPHGAEALVQAAKAYLGGRRTVFVTGLLADKDYSGMISLFNEVADEFVATAPDNPRALSPEDLAKALSAFGKPTAAFADVEQAMAYALGRCGADGAVVAAGSLYMAGDVRRFMRKRQGGK